MKLKLEQNQGKACKEQDLETSSFQKEGLLKGSQSLFQLDIPKYNRLLTDCAKLQKLDELLLERYLGGHRVLIFC